MAAACYETAALHHLGGPPKLDFHMAVQALQTPSPLHLSTMSAALVDSPASRSTASSVGPSSQLGSSAASPRLTLPQPKTPFKDYSQPLHVDCSVEYELPNAAKPPPGPTEPLLMIHPCYYRKADQERRTQFVNNLPATSSSSSSTSSSSTASSTAAATTGRSGRSRAAKKHNISGLMVNPVMPAVAQAPLHQGRSMGKLPSPSLASIHDAQAYHAALTALQQQQQQQHQQQQQQQHQHQQQLQQPAEATVQRPELLDLGALYPQYFQQHQPQQQQQQQQQQAPTQHRYPPYAHHPYRRPSAPVSGSLKSAGCKQTAATAELYAAYMRQQRLQQAFQAGAATAAFYEPAAPPPPYHRTLLPQS